MKTNFTSPTNLILTDSDNNIMGIIHCQAGQRDITKTLEMAVNEQTTTHRVKMLSDSTINGSNSITHFQVHVTEAPEASIPNNQYTEFFTLTQTATYEN